MSVPMPLHVLILEDHPTDAELMLDALRQAGFEPDWSLVDNEADYRAQLDRAQLDRAPEIILADYRLPQWDAPSALRALQASGLDIPFIMLSGTVGEEQAVECIKLGAADYLLKDRLARLGSAVTKALEDRRLRREKERTQAVLRESDLRYRRLFEAAKDGILILDAESGQIVDINPFLVDLLGYSRRDLLEKKVWELGLLTNLIASQDSFRGLVETGYARYDDLPLETRDGKVIAVEFVSNVYLTGDKTIIQCNIRDISERKEAEAAIKNLAKFPGENPQPVLRIGDDDQVLYANEPARSLLAEFVSEVGEVVPAAWGDLIIKARASLSSTSTEFPHRDKIWSLVAVPIKDNPYINIYGTDITERKRAETALARERSLLRTVIDNIPDLIYVKDDDGRFLLKNRADLQVMGAAPADEIVGKTDFDYYPRAVAERFKADDQQVIHSGQPMINREEESINLEGVTRWFLTTKVPLRDARGSVTGLVGISRDITERKQGDLELRKLYRAIEQSASSVIITDLQGSIEYVNPAFTRATGYTSEEVIGKNPRLLKSGETPREVYTQLWATLLAGGEWHGEFHNRKKDGDLFWESASISAIKNSEGQITNFLAVKEDITERKQSEEKLSKLNHTLAVLSDVNQAIVRIRVPSELFEKACHIAVDVGSFRMAWIGLLDPETTGVNLIAAAGVTDDYLEKLGGVLNHDLWGRGPTASALHTGEHVIVNNLEHDPRVAPSREHALNLGYRSLAIFPLKVAQEVRGVFSLYADQTAFFNDEEILLFDEMAADISFAMEFAEEEALRRKAEIALKEHAQALETMHRFLQTTLDAFPANTAVLDPDGTILNANASWAQFADANGTQSPVYYLGANYLTVCDTAAGSGADEAAFAAAGIRAVIEGRQGEFYLEYPCHSPSEKRWFMLRVTPFHEPAPRRVVVAHINVTERRLAEDAVRELNDDLERRVLERTAQYISAKERAETILNSSSNAILLCQTDGTIEEANPAFNVILGSRMDELLKQRLTDLAIPPDAARLEEAFRVLLDSRLPQRLEIPLQQYGGSSVDADLMLSPVLGQEGTLTGVVCVLHDITERKQIEDSLRAALAREKELGHLKSQFVSIVSHEFRNPLASILSGADLVLNYGDRMTDERKRQHLNTIKEQVHHLTGLMNDVLLIGKAENVGFEFAPAPLDLPAFCQTIVAQIQQTTGTSHTIRLSTEGACGAASADEKLLRHVLTNLLSNAVKYSPEGSTVTVELRCEQGQATLRVRDQGIGIPVEDQPRLFEAFHRATNVGMTPGTGLGLAITKRAIEAHQGTIDFESAAGQGTTFIVSFPIR